MKRKREFQSDQQNKKQCISNFALVLCNDVVANIILWLIKGKKRNMELWIHYSHVSRNWRRVCFSQRIVSGVCFCYCGFLKLKLTIHESMVRNLLFDTHSHFPPGLISGFSGLTHLTIKASHNKKLGNYVPSINLPFEHLEYLHVINCKVDKNELVKMTNMKKLTMRFCQGFTGESLITMMNLERLDIQECTDFYTDEIKIPDNVLFYKDICNGDSMKRGLKVITFDYLSNPYKSRCECYNLDSSLKKTKIRGIYEDHFRKQ
jgi:hypothetical protein